MNIEVRQEPINIAQPPILMAAYEIEWLFTL
nr:MAG TPA: hypothetical protein [Caudoviricetes sp.]